MKPKILIMDHTTTAILAITGLMSMGLYLGHNGQLLQGSLALIAYLAGYKTPNGKLNLSQILHKK